MITPLLMLAMMVAPALFMRARAAVSGQPADLRGAAAIGLGILFAFTASGHFVQTDAMSQMLPPWVPGRVPLVVLTGLLEVVIALGFFVPTWRNRAGWTAVVVLIAFFPANIYAAVQRVSLGGHAWGLEYLWIRAPLQLAILAWVAWFTIRPVALRSSSEDPMQVTGRP
jgi:uncharacterized membrane protein